MIPTIDAQKLIDSYFHREALYWEKIYKGTGVLEVIHQERLGMVLNLAEKFAPSRTGQVLDVGCGAGLAAVALAGRGYLVQAVDSVPEMVELTRASAAREGLQSRVCCARGDIQHLAFADSSSRVRSAAHTMSRPVTIRPTAT